MKDMSKNTSSTISTALNQPCGALKKEIHEDQPFWRILGHSLDEERTDKIWDADEYLRAKHECRDIKRRLNSIKRRLFLERALGRVKEQEVGDRLERANRVEEKFVSPT